MFRCLVAAVTICLFCSTNGSPRVVDPFEVSFHERSELFTFLDRVANGTFLDRVATPLHRVVDPFEVSVERKERAELFDFLDRVSTESATTNRSCPRKPTDVAPCSSDYSAQLKYSSTLDPYEVSFHAQTELFCWMDRLSTAIDTAIDPKNEETISARWAAFAVVLVAILLLYKALDGDGMFIRVFYDRRIPKEEIPVPAHGGIVDLTEEYNKHYCGDCPEYDNFNGDERNWGMFPGVFSADVLERAFGFEKMKTHALRAAEWSGYAAFLWRMGMFDFENIESWTWSLFVKMVLAVHAMEQAIGWGLLFLVRHCDLNDLFRECRVLQTPKTEEGTRFRLNSLADFAATLWIKWFYIAMHLALLIACGLTPTIGQTPVRGIIYKVTVHFYAYWPITGIHHLIFHQILFGASAAGMWNLWKYHKEHHVWNIDIYGTANNDDSWVEARWIVMFGQLALPIAIIKLSPWGYSVWEWFIFMALYRYVVNADHQNYDFREWWWPLHYFPGMADSVRSHLYHHSRWMEGSIIKPFNVFPAVSIKGSAFSKSWIAYFITTGEMDAYERDEYRRMQLVNSPHYILAHGPLKNYKVPSVAELARRCDWVDAATAGGLPLAREMSN